MQILLKPNRELDSEEFLNLEFISDEPLYGQMVDVKITKVISKFSMLAEHVFANYSQQQTGVKNVQILTLAVFMSILAFLYSVLL